LPSMIKPMPSSRAQLAFISCNMVRISTISAYLYGATILLFLGLE
jgi:hypothetical protein